MIVLVLSLLLIDTGTANQLNHDKDVIMQSFLFVLAGLKKIFYRFIFCQRSFNEGDKGNDDHERGDDENQEMKRFAGNIRLYKMVQGLP